MADASVVLVQPLGNECQSRRENLPACAILHDVRPFFGRTTVFSFGLPFPQETETATVRAFIRTLLGPRPQVNTIFGSVGSGDLDNIEVQMNALIAYRAKIVALIEMLEGGVRVPSGNRPTTALAGRKPIAAARAAKATKQTAA